MLRQVYAFRLKSRCGTSMHAWSAYAQRCIYLRSRFQRHQFLSVTTLIVHVANLRTLARSTKGQWLAFARKCTRRRHALSQIFIACVPPEYDNSSMQIMLWSFARKMWKRVGARRYFRQWKCILDIRAEQRLRAMRHCNAHVSSKYGSYAGRASALAAYYYTSEKVISSLSLRQKRRTMCAITLGNSLVLLFIDCVRKGKERKGPKEV